MLLNGCLFMRSLIYCLLARYLRYTKKIILGGKRRLRYQIYGCGCCFRMPRSLRLPDLEPDIVDFEILVNQQTHLLLEKFRGDT